MFPFQKIDGKVRKEVDEAVKAAKADPEPPVEEMYDHVYSNPDPHFKVRGCDPSIMVAGK
jgi:pyruvate dehydrogenase E1 component alpha subunit